MMLVRSSESGTIFRSGCSPSVNSKFPSIPEEDVVDRFLGLAPHETDEVGLRDRVDHEKNPAEQDLRLLLDLHPLLQLVLGDVAVGDEELSEVLAGVRDEVKLMRPSWK
jgi:hypothetical protein